MAGSKISVDTGRLEQTRKELQAKLDRIRKGVDQIRGDMNTLNSMWIGDTHEAFEAAVAEDILTFGGICDSMQELIGYESNAVTEYNKCEQQVADLIARIRI